MKKLFIAWLIFALAANAMALELVRQKNVATIISFPLVDSVITTALKTGAAGLDSEIDSWSDTVVPDGFADCSNEAIEIGSDGQYYLSLTQGEMNADYISVQIKSTDALTQTILINTTVPGIVWDEVLTGATHNVPSSAGKRVRDLSSAVIITGTSPGTGNSAIRIKLDGDASSTDGAYDPAVINIIAGEGIGQSRQIWEYDGANKFAYINRDWKGDPPDNTSEYVILSNSGDTHINEGLATGGGPSTITLNTLASDIPNAYVEQIVFIAAGVGQDQRRVITAYDESTRIATVEKPWDTEPTTGSVYAILPEGSSLLTDIATAVMEKDVSAFSDTDLAGGILIWLFNLSEGDQYIDTTTTPWQAVVHKKGDSGTEYLRKDLFDVSGGNITSVATVIGKQLEP